MNCNFSSLQGKYFKTLYLHGSVTFSLERLEIKNDFYRLLVILSQFHHCLPLN